MASSRSDSATRASTLIASPLSQRPISSPNSSPDATQTIFLTHPAAKLTSSPASSPRIVDPPTPTRHGSVHPSMSRSRDRGARPGAECFTDASSDSAWEDSEGEITQIFPALEDMSRNTAFYDMKAEEYEQRAGRRRSRAIDTSNQHVRRHVHDSGLGIEGLGSSNSPSNEATTKRAREMPLKRPGKEHVRLVHTRSNPGTPRDSYKSSNYETDEAMPETPNKFPYFRSDHDRSNSRRPISSHTRTRANTTDSVLADSIIDAHVMTMRALESLSPAATIKAHDPTLLHPGVSDTGYSSSASSAPDRFMQTLSMSASEPGCPTHLPSHFIKTPYPFSAKKEFPKPTTRPRRSVVSCDTNRYRDRLDSGYGIAELQKEYRSRMREKTLKRSNSHSEFLLPNMDHGQMNNAGASWYDFGVDDVQASVLWLTLRKNNRRERSTHGLEKSPIRLEIPSNLTIDQSKEGQATDKAMGFDDKYFAERLQAGYHQLTGNWFKRSFSARTLNCVQLGQISSWSGSTPQTFVRHTSHLLAAGDGVDMSSDMKSPFTENGLMKLYQNPTSGKAIYTWCHWARRVAASNRPVQHCYSASHLSSATLRRRARSLDAPKKQEKHIVDAYVGSLHPSQPPESITTVQFVQVISKMKVMIASGLMLLLSAGAALLWVFAGLPDSGWAFREETQRSARVPSGMAIGILVILLESLGFGVWIWLS